MTKLTKKELSNVQLRSWMYQWQSFNYESMQATGFTQAIGPALEKIYAGNDELIAEKMVKYLAFYNTENTMSQIIMGACLAIEETEAEGCTDVSLGIRTGLMGPFAGLGDSLFKVSCKVILGSLIGYMALDGNAWLGLLLGVLVQIVGFYIIKFKFFWMGYNQGTAFITSKQDQIKALTNAAVVLGLTVVGCMIPSTVKVSIKTVFAYGEASQTIQAILDSIFPFLLPVVVTALVYWGLGLKRMTTVKMVWIIIIVATILTFFQIL